MATVYDPQAPKKPTNLSVNSDLLSQARSLDVNLSATLEEALEAIVRERRRHRWLEENRAAIGTYNEDVERNPVFSAGRRSF